MVRRPGIIDSEQLRQRARARDLIIKIMNRHPNDMKAPEVQKIALFTHKEKINITTVRKYLNQLVDEEHLIKEKVGKGFLYYTVPGYWSKLSKERKDKLIKSVNPLLLDPFKLDSEWQKVNIKTPFDLANYTKRGDYDTQIGKVETSESVIKFHEHELWFAGTQANIWMQGLNPDDIDLEVFTRIQDLIKCLIKKRNANNIFEPLIAVDLMFDLEQAQVMLTQNLPEYPEFYQEGKRNMYILASERLIKEAKTGLKIPLGKNLVNRIYLLNEYLSQKNYEFFEYVYSSLKKIYERRQTNI